MPLSCDDMTSAGSKVGVGRSPVGVATNEEAPGAAESADVLP